MKGKTLASEGKFTEDDVKYLNGNKAQMVMFGEANIENIVEDVTNDPDKEESNEEMNNEDSHSCVPCGLVNLGNNCYMNSILQAIYAMVSSLNIQQPLEYENNCDTALVLAMMKMFQQMSSATQPLENHELFLTLHERFPFFGERGQNGQFLQHDSNEFFIQIMNSLKSVIKYEKKNFIKQFFMGIFSKNITCPVTNEESKKVEDFMYLPILLLERCSGLQAAIGESLKSTFTKRSSVSGENVEFNVESLFQRLPAFLTVNYLRFSYKDQAQKNCKIFRQLSFPFELDVYEYCTDELKAKFEPFRKQKRELEEGKSNDENILEPLGMDDDFGCNNTGIYSLKAVVTHKGRTTNSGHYVAWIRRSNVWFKCDDSNITVVSERDVAALSGGADSHLSYILFYGPTELSDFGYFHLPA